MEESQKQMTLAASAARLSVWNWDATPSRIREAARYWRYGGTDDHGIALERVIKSVHPADRANVEQAVEKALGTGEDFDIEYRTVKADGRVRWIAARGRAQAGNSQRLYGVALDVTKRKMAELRSAQEHAALSHMTRVSMMGQLSAAIAHQLNHPLAAILGNAEAAQKMLGRAEVDLQELREICSDIVRDDQRASEVNGS
jgi:C4-dicarboxylate-specific signal transduction histidine kinase